MNAKLITEYIALKKYLIARITSLMTAFSSSFQYLQKNFSTLVAFPHQSYSISGYRLQLLAPPGIQQTLNK